MADLKDLGIRFLSALIMAPVVLYAVYTGGPAFLMMVLGFSLVALWEWLHLADSRAGGDVAFLSYGTLFVIVIMSVWHSPIFSALFGGAFGTALYIVAIPSYQKTIRWIVFGIPYIGGCALSLLYLRATPDIGMMLVWYILAVVWGTDIGAYAAGRLIGGPKLAPAISPKKTWAGLGGGVLLAAICGYGVAWGFHAQQPVVGLLLALVLAVISQIGDLFESWMKRRANVKHSSDLIPGHGGVLDRIDGLIFATIVFALFQATFGLRMDWW